MKLDILDRKGFADQGVVVVAAGEAEELDIEHMDGCEGFGCYAKLAGK
jgi:hypothetical protein